MAQRIFAVASIAFTLAFTHLAGAAHDHEAAHDPYAEPPLSPSQPPASARSSPGDTVKTLDELQAEAIAIVARARISEPERVAKVLTNLRLESTAHLGRLDQQEWSEMIAEMRSAGVTLGSRNKLRLFVATESARATVSYGGLRRAQAVSNNDEADSKSGSTNDDAGTIFGVSSDSAFERLSV